MLSASAWSAAMTSDKKVSEGSKMVSFSVLFLGIMLIVATFDFS